MRIYKFFDTDRTGQAELDISGVQYQHFLQACLRHCATVSVMVFLDCAERVQPWEPYRIPITPEVQLVYAHYGLGSTGQAGSYEARHYLLTPQMKRMLQDQASSLFQWTWAWGHGNPDDISFYRPDGSVFFASLIHEGECTLY